MPDPAPVTSATLPENRPDSRPTLCSLRLRGCQASYQRASSEPAAQGQEEDAVLHDAKILISAAVWKELAHDTEHGDDLGEIQVKGRAQPVHVYKLA